MFICLLGVISVGLFAAKAQDDTSWQAKYLPKEKEDELKQKASRQPNDAKPQFQLADAYLEADRWGDAALALERVIQLKPDSAVAHYYLGLCYEYLNRKEDAVQAFQKAAASRSLELFGRSILSSEPLLSLADEYEDLRRYDEAIAVLNELFRQNSSDAELLYRIGLIYAAQGKREETMKIADRLSASNRELLLKRVNAPTAATVDNNANSLQPNPNSPTEPVTASLRPTILYKERARYSHFARVRKVQGAVVLRVVYYADGRLGNVEVIRPLPYGLTTEAIRAVKKIRFQPAIKDGKPVSVRGNVEFNFTLY
ncbi:MAG TPA: TonB family protein [Blastocatellia bacterium]|nr:TonB family protein [Blastocatellia bacterium]HNG30292.1 TonB family protein [Blastocatellia bacterium]